jgi:cobalt/nickel transport system permease protein
VGAFAGYGVFRGMRRFNVPFIIAAFAAGLVGDWATYATTSLELSTALHGSVSMWKAFVVLVLAFSPTQIPLGVLEGFMAVGAFSFLLKRRPDILFSLGVIKDPKGSIPGRAVT